MRAAPLVVATRRPTSRVLRSAGAASRVVVLPAPQAAKPALGPSAKSKVRRPPDTHASVTLEIEAVDAKLDAAVDRTVAAAAKLSAGEGGSATGMALAETELEALRAQRAALAKRLAAVPPAPPPKPPPAPFVVRLEKVYADADDRLLAAVDALATVRSDAELTAAVEELGSARRYRDVIRRRLVRAKRTKRPRSDENPRPRGRGFVLA